jgi:hypothetical protein
MTYHNHNILSCILTGYFTPSVSDMVQTCNENEKTD